MYIINIKRRFLWIKNIRDEQKKSSLKKSASAMLEDVKLLLEITLLVIEILNLLK